MITFFNIPDRAVRWRPLRRRLGGAAGDDGAADFEGDEAGADGRRSGAPSTSPSGAKRASGKDTVERGNKGVGGTGVGGGERGGAKEGGAGKVTGGRTGTAEALQPVEAEEKGLELETVINHDCT